jgi:myosin heavy subunit
MSSVFQVGEWVWIEEEKHCFLPVQVIEVPLMKGMVGVVKTEGGEVLALEEDASARITPCNPQVMSSKVDNLIKLSDLTEAAILHNLRIRFDEDKIYTQVGSVLLAVNPFQRFQIYTTKALKEYQSESDSAGGGEGTLAPHIFRTANRAYKAMITDGVEQACIISGESGSGKTEATKHILQCLATISSSSQREQQKQNAGLETQILQANPLMEAFGNAKTTLNNNSSRFGKLISIAFSPQGGGTIMGSSISHYLLESSRVTHQADGEQNYHIFYYLLQHARDNVGTAALLSCDPPSTDPTSHQSSSNAEEEYLLAPTGTGTTGAQEDQLRWAFEEVLEAMEVLNISTDEQQALWKTVGALLHLGEASFRAEAVDYGEGAMPVDAAPLKRAAGLLSIDIERLEQCFCFRTMVTNWGDTQESVMIPHSPEQAARARDALLKALYSRTFDWTLHKVNCTIGEELHDMTLNTGSNNMLIQRIHVLDIFGFEVFAKNSLEQLCINYCNEMLQGHFNEHIFVQELEEYACEGIDMEDCTFTDNCGCVELIGGPASTGSIFALLDDELKIPRSTDQTWLAKVVNEHQDKHPNFGSTRPQLAASQFTVIHFAGEVGYQVEDILSKNRNELHQDLAAVIESSVLPNVQQVVARAHAAEAQEAQAAEAARDGTRRTKQQPSTTLTSHFKRQLVSLMDTLHTSEPHFVRCIKSNDGKAAANFNATRVLQQLRYAGVLEISKIRQLGFPVRMLHGAFMRRYFMLVPEARRITELLQGLYQSEMVAPAACTLGRTKVLLKQDAGDKLEVRREVLVVDYVVAIQRHARGVVARVKHTHYLQVLGRLRRATASKDMATLETSLREAKLSLPSQGTAVSVVLDAQACFGMLQMKLQQMASQLRAASSAGELTAPSATADPDLYNY